MSTSGSANYVLLTRLADEFAARYRAGERPALQEYLDRYPELADDIRELFPAMVEMEQVKEDHEEAHEPAAAPPAPALQQLGDFRILREVGKGGMGIVYEAEQVSLGRHVALKVLPRNLLLDARAKRRFEREAKAAAKLHHTNIVPVFGVGEQDGVPYYVMQFIQGLGLDQVLDELRKLQPGNTKCGPLTAGEPRVSRKELAPAQLARSLLTGDFVCREAQPAEEAAARVEDTVCQEREPADSPRSSPLSDSLTPSSSSVVLPGQGRDRSRSKSGKPTYWKSVAAVGVQVAEALAYAHQQGVQHRDIKPSNLLLDTQARVWVTDFGLAKADDQQNLTHTGDLLGTLRYMPPEAFEGKTDARSDLYSLGLTLYELLAFRPAFEERERNRLIKQVTQTEPARLGRLNRSVPRDLETIVHKAIDREPGRRYQTAADLAADLQRFMDDEPIQARRISAIERLARWCRHNPVIAGLAATLVLVFLAGFVGVAWKWQEAERQKEIAQAAEQMEAKQRTVAVEQADRATREAEHSRRLLYAADMNLACQAWDAGDTGRARALLERQRPPAGQEAFEWRYLWRHCQDDSRLTFRGHAGEVTGLSLTPDGRTLATCGSDQSVCIWDLAAHRHVRLLQRTVNGVALAPDGKLVALAQFNGRMVQLWDRAARRVVASFPAPSRVLSVALSPDGSLLAAGCVGTVRIWDVPARRELEVDHAAKHTGPVTCLAFAPDGRTLASAGLDSTVQLWDVVARRVRASLQGHSSSITALSFAPDRKTLASASSDTTVRFWDTATGQSVSTPLRGLRTSLNAVSFSPDGKTLATGGEDGTIRIWNAATKDALVLLRGHGGPVMALAFAPDGQSLFSGSRDGTIKVWNVSPGIGPNILTRSKATVSSVAFSPDGKTLAVADTFDKTVKLWDLASRTLVHRLTSQKDPVIRVTYAPGGRTLASTSFDGPLRLWDVATQQPVSEFMDKATVQCCAFSPDGKLIAAATGGSEEVFVWDIAHGQRVTKLSGSYVQFSPDGALVAASLGNTVQLWEVATWQKLSPLTGFAASVHCLAFAPDGKSLVVCEANGTVRLWDMLGKRQVASRRGHTSTIQAVAFSPDGRSLATAGGDSTVKLWDVALLQEVASLSGHEGPVEAVAFSPDGNTLASASADATVRLWQAPPVGEAPREPAEAPSASPPAEVLHLFGLEVHDKARATLTTPENTQRVNVTAIGTFDWNVQLVQAFDDLQEGATYTIRFRAKADAPRRIWLSGQAAVPDWRPVGLYQHVGLTEKWENYEFQFRAKDLAALNKIAFLLGGRTGTVWIADFTLTKNAK
jgi:WD40 repeat protein/serine/threonine protein kinase